MNNQLNRHVSVIDLASITADADVFGLYFPQKSKIVSVKLLNGASIAQDDTDKAVIKLMNGSTEIAKHSTALTGGTSALTANVLAAVPLTSAVNGEVEVAAGSLLKVNYDESGTYAMTTAKVFVEWYPL